jgi:tetratricopeptide (TPR) repeat protein
MAEGQPCLSFGVPCSQRQRCRLVAAATATVAGLLCAPIAVGNPLGQPRSTTTSDFSRLSTDAEAAREAGALDKAVPLYRKALALRPDWQEGWWALGTILYDQDSPADAARAFQRLVALDPKNGTAHLMLALCEYQVERFASAMEHIQAAKRYGVQSDGQLPRVMAYHEGMLRLRDASYERAIEALQPLASAGVEEETLDAALGLAVLLMRPDDKRADDPATRHIVLRAGRAERHHLAKEFDAAKAGYEALVREASAFPNVHYAYGRFLLATADLESGIAELTKEIAHDPAHVRARMQIAAARYRVDSAAGIPFALEVVKREPDYPFGHYLLGLLYFDTGDITRAIPEFEAAARMVPSEPQFQFALGNAYARAGRKEEAARARAAFVRLKKGEPASGYEKLDPRDLDPGTQPPSRERPDPRPR